MKKTVFASALFGSWLACVAAGLSAQPIEPAVPTRISDYFEQACAQELATMNASWNALGMNGVNHGGYYQSVAAMSADAVRERFRDYDRLARRSDTEQYRATNVWEDCLLNARLRQLGEAAVPRPPQPVTTGNDPPPDPGAPADLIVDADGRERYVMPDGRDCVIIQSGQERVPNQPGVFNQTLSARNRCNIPIVVRACAEDGSCFDINALANTTTTQVVGTTQGLVAGWQPIKVEARGEDGQFGPDPGGNDTPYQTGGDEVVDDNPIDFGDDGSPYARDGECDDPRFSGPGAADSPLERDYFHDASDCRALLAAGNIEFTGYTDRGQSPNGDAEGRGDFWGTMLETINTGIDLYNTIQDINGQGNDQGNDTGAYSNDGEYADEDDGDDCNYNSDGDPETVCTVQ